MGRGKQQQIAMDSGCSEVEEEEEEEQEEEVGQTVPGPGTHRKRSQLRRSNGAAAAV